MVALTNEPTAEDYVYAAVKLSTVAALAGNVSHASFMAGWAQAMAYVHGASYIEACERHAGGTKMPPNMRATISADVDAHAAAVERAAREAAADRRKAQG